LRSKKTRTVHQTCKRFFRQWKENEFVIIFWEQSCSDIKRKARFRRDTTIAIEESYAAILLVGQYVVLGPSEPNSILSSSKSDKMRSILLFGLIGGKALSQEAGANRNQPGAGVGAPNSLAPAGDIPPGCWKSLNGPAFKLATLSVDEKTGLERKVSGEVVTQDHHVPEQGGSQLSDSIEANEEAQRIMARRGLRLAKMFRRQGAPSESDVTVTSRVTRTSTATVIISPSSVQSQAGSGTKTVYGATVKQAPNGQVQVVETAVPIVLQPKASAKPDPFAPLPPKVPRITQAANGQVQASKNQGTAQRADSRRGFVAKDESIPNEDLEGIPLEVTIANGALKDKLGRQGYISRARQVQ
jgi:hypothetical protein